MAKLYRILEGLKLAQSKVVSHVILTSDSQPAIERLNREDIAHDIYANVIRKCREIKLEFKDVRCVFARCEENQVADALANESRRMEDEANITKYLPIPSSCCFELLRNDCNRLFKP